jgi:hypothetical protein
MSIFYEIEFAKYILPYLLGFIKSYYAGLGDAALTPQEAP